MHTAPQTPISAKLRPHRTGSTAASGNGPDLQRQPARRNLTIYQIRRYESPGIHNQAEPEHRRGYFNYLHVRTHVKHREPAIMVAELSPVAPLPLCRGTSGPGADVRKANSSDHGSNSRPNTSDKLRTAKPAVRLHRSVGQLSSRVIIGLQRELKPVPVLQNFIFGRIEFWVIVMSVR